VLGVLRGVGAVKTRRRARTKRWAQAALAGAMMAAAAGTAVAQVNAPPPATFPSALERGALLTWLKRDTDITPAQVVAVTPQALTALISTFPAGGGQGPRVVIRAEALSRETFARTGALSWHVSLNADCEGHRVRMGETTGYAERNLLGERRMLRQAEQEWRPPEAGTALDNAWRAACDPAFRGPLVEAGAMPVAQADRTPLSKPPPPPAKPEPPPAAAAVVNTRSKPAPPPPQPSPPQPSSPQPSPPQPPPKAGGPFAAQIGAYSSEAAARAALAGLGARLAGRGTRIESAQVDGKTWRRALVTGFPDRGEAGRFCDGLQQAGKACFPRPALPGR